MADGVCSNPGPKTAFDPPAWTLKGHQRPRSMLALLKLNQTTPEHALYHYCDSAALWKGNCERITWVNGMNVYLTWQYKTHHLCDVLWEVVTVNCAPSALWRQQLPLFCSKIFWCLQLSSGLTSINTFPPPPQLKWVQRWVTLNLMTP